MQTKVSYRAGRLAYDLARPRIDPILEDAGINRENIREKAVSGVRDFFPVIGSRYDLDVEDVAVEKKEYSNSDHKKAIFEGKSLQEPVKGNLVLKDKQGKVVDKGGKSTLLNLPWYSRRHTFVLDGNEYNIANQVRLKPGVYTRKKGNEELEAQFNVQGTANFKLTMQPETGFLYMQVGTANLGLYPVLLALGAHPNEIKRAWGEELTEVNAAKFAGKETTMVDELYRRLIYKPKPGISREQKREALDEYFQRSHLDSNVTLKTLGRSYDKVNKDSILSASKKLLSVFRKAEEVDDRDNLEFKSFHQVDDLINENLRVNTKQLQYKTKQKLDHTFDPTAKDVIPPSPFTPVLRSFLTSTQLKDLSDQYNGIDNLDSMMKVTSLGEGGIGTDRAITMESRQVHPSHLGIIDPVATPESGKLGIDLRMTQGAHRDEKGTLYSTLKDAKTGEIKQVPTHEMGRSVVGFPGQEKRHKQRKPVEAIKNGEVQSVPANEVNYFMPDSIISMASPSTSLVPFFESIQGNRAIMAAKHATQALPLDERETPFVQVESPRKGVSMEEVYGGMLALKSPADGTVEKIDEDYIYLRPEGGKKTLRKKQASDDLIRIPYDNYLPSGSKSGKTYAHQFPLIKPGDKVKQGQLLADSHETEHGSLALGRNLRTAYMPYKGYNSNDAVVISEGAAKKLTSSHEHKKILDVDSELILDRESHRTHFGSKYSRAQYDKLDRDGVIKKDVKVEPGDILVAALRKATLTPEASALGRLHKSLVRPYHDEALIWSGEFPGVAADVFRTAKRIAIGIRTKEPMKLGDKLANRYAGKGIVSMVVPDDQMIRDEQDRPVEAVYTSGSIITRVNPSQILETGLGKVVEKTGKPIKVPRFADRNNVQWVKDELKKHNVKDKETLYDPVTKKKIPQVMVGPQHVYKLAKTTETNYSARGIENYDLNEQPSSGGTSGSKALGRMEWAALLGHNARNVLQDAASIKSQKNDEYWQRVRLNLPTPPPKTNFAYDKFGTMLTGAGVRMDKANNTTSLAPLTDNDITKMSRGEIKTPKFVRSKDLKPEKGGFFDEALTGGATGNRWTHIDLAEPVVNPVFKDPARRLLGMTGIGFEEKVSKEGALAVKRELNSLNLAQKKKELREKAKRASGSSLQDTVSQIQAIEALEKNKLKPGDAYVLSKVPVTPPSVRPILPNKKGELLMGDANYLLRDVMLANDAVKNSQDLPEDFKPELRKHLSDSVSALFGTGDPVSPQSKQRGVKGYLSAIAGTDPKHGFFQNKLIRRQQDLTGRSTAAPDQNLDIDEIGLPEDMMWKLYEPFTMRRLTRKGTGALDAKKMMEDKHPNARMEMIEESKQRPIFWNRAPSLHRFSMAAAYPKPIPGKTIKVPAPWPESGMNLDYDGDTVTAHVPVSPEAVDESKNMLLSKQLYSDKSRGDLLVKPQHESIMGLWRATSDLKPSQKPPRKFKNWQELRNSYERGDIAIDDPVEVES